MKKVINSDLPVPLGQDIYIKLLVIAKHQGVSPEELARAVLTDYVLDYERLSYEV